MKLLGKKLYRIRPIKLSKGGFGGGSPTGGMDFSKILPPAPPPLGERAKPPEGVVEDQSWTQINDGMAPPQDSVQPIRPMPDLEEGLGQIRPPERPVAAPALPPPAEDYLPSIPDHSELGYEITPDPTYGNDLEGHAPPPVEEIQWGNRPPMVEKPSGIVQPDLLQSGIEDEAAEPAPSPGYTPPQRPTDYSPPEGPAGEGEVQTLRQTVSILRKELADLRQQLAAANNKPAGKPEGQGLPFGRIRPGGRPTW